MSDNPFRKQAEELIENVAELQKHVLLKHSAGLLAAIYEEREKWKHRAESSERALAAERERADRNQEDAERYRWLQSEAKQVYMHPNAEIDNRMRWEFPVLIALTCINSEVSLNAAIDAARRK